MAKDGPLWLKSAFAGTLLPGSRWFALQQHLDNYLKEFVEQQSKREQLRQALYSLLGYEWLSAHYPDEPYNPMLIEAPFMAPEFRDDLKTELRASAIAYVERRLDEDDVWASSAFAGYEKSAVASYLDALETAVVNAMYRVEGTVDVELIAAADVVELSADERVDEEDDVRFELLGLALGSLLKREPQKLARVQHELQGRLLPSSLRQHIWMLVLHDMEHHNMCMEAIDSEAKHQDVDPNISRVDGMITSAVGELLKGRLRRYGTDEVMRGRVITVLNLVYHCTGAYASQTVVLLLPLLKGLPEVSNELLCSMVIRLCELTTWSSAHRNDIVKGILRVVEAEDATLLPALEDTYTYGRSPGFSEIKKRQAAGEEDALTIKDTAALVDQWVHCLFVGTCGDDLLLYFWDQMFLLGFDVLPELGGAFALGLRDRLLAAKGPSQLYDVARSGRVLTTTVAAVFRGLAERRSEGGASWVRPQELPLHSERTEDGPNRS